MLILHYNYFNVWVYRTCRIVSLCFANVLCHSEERSDVRISRKGHLVKAMVRCCLRSDVCLLAHDVAVGGDVRRSARCDSTLSLSHCDKSLFCDVLSDIFLFRENCINNCHSFPLHLSLYFIKYASSILFLKILKYYNSTILYNRPKKSHLCATFAHSMHIFKYFHTFF